VESDLFDDQMEIEIVPVKLEYSENPAEDELEVKIYLEQEIEDFLLYPNDPEMTSNDPSESLDPSVIKSEAQVQMEETEEIFFIYISNSVSETFQVSLKLSASGALEH